MTREQGREQDDTHIQARIGETRCGPFCVFGTLSAQVHMAVTFGQMACWRARTSANKTKSRHFRRENETLSAGTPDRIGACAREQGEQANRREQDCRNLHRFPTLSAPACCRLRSLREQCANKARANKSTRGFQRLYFGSSCLWCHGPTGEPLWASCGS